MQPKHNDGKDWKLIWNSEFNESSLNTDKWRIETLELDFQGNNAQASQHRTSNAFGIDENGNVGKKNYVVGRRHAGYYNGHHDKIIKVQDGSLVLGGYRSTERDHSMISDHHPYVYPKTGEQSDHTMKTFVPWIDTYCVSWHDGAVRPARQDNPNFHYRYGLIEVCINLEQMTGVEEFRLSGWLLPSVDPDVDEDLALIGTTYNNVAKDGNEQDIFEVIVARDRGNFLLCKGIGGGAKNIQPVDCRDFGIDLLKGDHVISHEWTPDALIWRVDGVEVARDEQAVPQVSKGIYITREICSGVGSGDGAKAIPPYRNRDAGLWGGDAGTESAENINADKAIVRWVRVYQDTAQTGNWISKPWRDGQGVEATIFVSTIPEPKTMPLNPQRASTLDIDHVVQLLEQLIAIFKSWK